MLFDHKKILQAASFGIASLSITNAIAATNIEVLVVYTASAEVDMQDFSCVNLSTKAKAANERVLSLTGYKHPCLENPSFASEPSAGMRNLIDVAIKETNDIFKNSGVSDVNINLAGALKLENETAIYQETFSSDDITHNMPLSLDLAKGAGVPYQLYKLRNRIDNKNSNNPENALLNNVHELRKIYDADLVIMLVGDKAVEPTSATLSLPGLAMGIGVNDPRDGFAVLKANIATTPYFTFSHELSHLFGANHYNIRILPLAGAQDNNLSFPDLVNGKVDNWAFQNTVSSSGEPIYEMYTDIMSAPIDASGNLIFIDKNKAGSPAVQYQAWSSKNSDGTCSFKEAPTDQPFNLTATTIPSLSTTTPNFPKTIQMGTTGSVNEKACITVHTKFEDGTEEKRLVQLQDTDSTPRNSKRISEKYATTISQFSSKLSSIVDQNAAAVAIDFGPDNYSSPIYNYDAKTINPKCTQTTTGYCFWNNVTSTSITNVNTPIVLFDQTSTNSGNTLSIIKAFRGKNQLQPAMGASLSYGRDEAATMALTDYMTATRGYTAPEISINGLQQTKKYVFRIFGAVDSSDFRVANFYLTSANTSGASTTEKRQLGTHQNISRFIEYRNITPLNGKVSLKIEADSSVSLLQSVGLSAIVYFPEN